LAVAASLLLAQPFVLAQEPAPSAPENKALALARRNLSRWQQRANSVAESAALAQASLEAAQKAVADAKAALAAAEKAVADSTAAVTTAEQNKTSAEKALAEAQEKLKKTEADNKDDAEAIKAASAALETAQKNARDAAAQLAEAQERKKQAEAAKVLAEKQVPQAEQQIKPAAEAKAAADKLAAETQTHLKTAQDRAAALEKGPAKPDPAQTRLLQTFSHDRPLLACRFDPLGDHLFAAAQDNNLHRWDTVTGAAVHPAGHKTWLSALQWLPGAEPRLVSAGHDGQLLFWQGPLGSPAVERAIPAHAGYIRAVALSPDGQLLATAGNDNLVKVWSSADGSLVKELAGHERHVYNVAFDPAGKFLVSGDLLGVLKQWEVGTWNLVRDLDAKVLWKFDGGFRADVGGIRGLDFSPDGKYLAAAGITEVSNAFAGVGVPAVVLFEFESGKQLRVMKPKEAFQGSCWGVRFHPSGEFLVAAGGGNGAALWFFKLEEDKSFFDVKLPSVAYDVALHPDGLRLAVALYDNTLRIYDMGPKPEAPAAP